MLRGYSTQAGDHAAHVAFQNSLQSIAGKRFLVFFVSMEDFRGTPHVAGNMRNVENIDRQL